MAVKVGAGFQVTPNGTKVLKHFGIIDALAPKAAEPTLLQVRRWSDGKILSRTDDWNVEMRRKYDAPFWDLHRVDVQHALADRAAELGVDIRLNAKVEDIDFNDAVLTLAIGETFHADLLVGADGIWSKCRQKFLTANSLAEDSPLPTGDLAYRIVLDVAEVTNQEVKDWISKPSCQFWIGPGAHVVAYSIRGGEVLNMVLLVPDDLPPDVARQAGSMEEMRAIFSNWDPMLNKFLDQVQTVDKWKLMHRPELESWISDKSNFVFVGDACEFHLADYELRS
jgi:salicylate hydroxylase